MSEVLLVVNLEPDGTLSVQHRSDIDLRKLAAVLIEAADKEGEVVAKPYVLLANVG